MKKIVNSLLFTSALALAWGCQEEVPELDPTLDVSGLQYDISQGDQDFMIRVENQTQGIIPVWDFNGVRSLQQVDTFQVPFAGDYMLYFRAYGQGGVSPTDSAVVTVTENNPDYFTAPEWEALNNGIAGKTWVLDFENGPLNFYGVDYGSGGDGDWSWEPDYTGNEWLMENKAWGEMTFNLDGGFNYSVQQIDANGNMTNCSGTYSMNLDDGFINLRGCDMLFGGGYYDVVSNWGRLRIFEITENTLILGVLRDQSEEGQAWLGFQFTVKE